MTLFGEKKGLLLLNLGTPAGPETGPVREYLKEFLMDLWVLDIPFLFRWLLVHGAILPKRPAASAAAYQKIWTERGSPLYFHLMDLVEKVRTSLGDSWDVMPAMRYGQPSIEKALFEFKNRRVQELLIFPLYPQYSLAATESSLRECDRLAKKVGFEGRIRSIRSFFQEDLFIEAFAKIAEEGLRGFSYDYLLMSFHGLPERQVKKTDLSGGHCLGGKRGRSGDHMTGSKDHGVTCCDEILEVNQDCYRAQCYQTARLLARRLGLSPDRYSVCFQSRLGRTPWIQPFTDEFYRTLPSRGIRRLAVMCPSFVADCLETLEEVQIRGKEEFIQNGGEDLKLIPSLNSSDVWAHAVREMVRKSFQ